MAKVAKSVLRRVHRWLIRYHLVLVIVLSVFHIGLVSLPTRDSGKADCARKMAIRAWRSDYSSASADSCIVTP
jgi:hypothetical protein